ncbi:MAG: hypothetical protein GY793_08900 [Proteobacteria bacterium]|nr:hypothetical protein [Pseudomonadota bacterium]
MTAVCVESYPAKQIESSKKANLALKTISREKPIAELARENNVSRKFLYQQKNKAINAIQNTFLEDDKSDEDKVLFYIPVTKKWLYGVVLALLLHCNSSYRGIKRFCLDMLDYNISEGKISDIVLEAKIRAIDVNRSERLERIGTGTRMNFITMINRCLQVLTMTRYIVI